MEAVFGTKVDKIDELKKKEINLKKCADILIEAYLIQILRFSFYHADPHPGNIAIDDNGVVIFYDFGMVGSISKYNRNVIIKLLIAILREDIDKVSEIIVEIGRNEFIDEDYVIKEIDKLLMKYYRTALREISLVDVIKEVFKLANEVNLTLSPEFLLLGKCLLELEGLITIMVPDVSFENLAEKHIYKYIWKDIIDMPSLKKVIFTFLDIRDLVTNLPKRINKVIKKLEDKNDKSSFNLKTQKVYLKTMNTFLFVVFWGILFFAIYRMIELKLSLLHIILFSFAYILGLIFYLIFFSK
jgi:ubiquinone biosynthesis protein